MPFTIDRKQEGPAEVITIVGVLDGGVVGMVENVLENPVRERKLVILEMSGVTGLRISAWKPIADAAVELKNHRSKLKIRNPSASVTSFMQNVGSDIEVENTEE